MRIRRQSWLFTGISVVVLASAAAAQDEQWLQYRSAREDGQILGGTSTNLLKLTADKPEAVKLPQFKGEDQLFAPVYPDSIVTGEEIDKKVGRHRLYK